MVAENRNKALSTQQMEQPVIVVSPKTVSLSGATTSGSGYIPESGIVNKYIPMVCPRNCLEVPLMTATETEAVVLAGPILAVIAAIRTARPVDVSGRWTVPRKLGVMLSSAALGSALCKVQPPD